MGLRALGFSRGEGVSGVQGLWAVRCGTSCEGFKDIVSAVWGTVWALCGHVCLRFVDFQSLRLRI